jgi:hypothetical protein
MAPLASAAPRSAMAGCAAQHGAIGNFRNLRSIRSHGLPCDVPGYMAGACSPARMNQRSIRFGPALLRHRLVHPIVARDAMCVLLTALTAIRPRGDVLPRTQLVPEVVRFGLGEAALQRAERD